MDISWLVIPLFATTAVLLVIGGYSLRFHAVPAARPFMAVVFVGAIWAFTYALGMLNQNLAYNIFLVKIRLSLQPFMPTAMFATALEHAHLARWLTKPRKLLLLLLPLITLIIVWSDALFPILRYNFNFIPNSPVLQSTAGPWSWVMTTYGYVLGIATLFILGYALLNRRGIYLRQTLYLTLALLFPLATNLLTVVIPIGPPGYNITPSTLLLTGVLSAWALFRHQWLAIAPTARSLAVDDMSDAMIVVDLDHCIVDFNQVAANLFGITSRDVGQPIKNSIPAWKHLPSYPEKGPLLNEFELEHDGQARYFEVIINQVDDQHNHAIGHVIVLREFTQRRKTDLELKKRINDLEVINAISVNISSQLDMHSLIPLVGKKLEEIFNVHSAFVALYEPVSASIQIPYWTINHEHIQAEPIKMGHSLTSVILQTRQPLLITENFQMMSKKLGAVLRFTDQYGYPKTWLGAPVIVRDERLGVIGVQDYEKECAFTQEDVRLLQTIAANLGIAIQNARLYEEARRKADQMSTLYNIGVTLTGNLEFDQVLRELGERCREILPMDVFYVAVYDEDTHLVSHPLFYENDIERKVPIRDIYVSPGLSGEIILNRKTIYLADALDRKTRRAHHLVRAGGKAARSYVGAPMVVSGRVVGVLSMQSYQPNAYTQDQIRLLETIANVAGVAIENSRLFEQAQAEIEQRRHAQESLLQANQDLHIQLNKVRTLQHELREQATRDPLTGLHNRRYLNTTLKQRIQQAEDRGLPLSVLMIDIDLFKNFNDTYGHFAGDALLQALAEMLRHHTRTMDIACRYGGEEFLLVLSNTSLETGERRAEELRQAFFKSENKFGEHILRATISIGVAAFPTHGTGAEELIMQADQALYAAKAAGRNKVIVWAK
jgi:diguanylate cyclase (GGDEF)-like protein/PAS domain S-box-containing protein